MSDDPYLSDDHGADAVRSSDFFGRLDRRARADISDELDLVELAAGDPLFAQGDPGDSMYVVERGLLEVRMHDEDGLVRVLDRLAPGAAVGEMALMSGRPRSADVVALVDSQLMRLSRSGFERLVERYPAIVAGFAVAVTPRIHRLQVAGMLQDLFGEMEPAALHALQEQLVWRRLADGEALFTQGDEATSMFVVVTGRLQVVYEESDAASVTPTGRPLGEVGRGETIGEFALINDEVRSASVYAIRDTDVVEVTRSVFEALIADNPQAMNKIARLIVLRLQRTQRIVKDKSRQALGMAIVPTAGGDHIIPFAERLRDELEEFGPTTIFTSESFDEAYGRPGAAQTEQDEAFSLLVNSWLQEQEQNYQHILYVADPTLNQWTQRCLSQADRVLLVGSGSDDPRLGPCELVPNPRTRQELVLLHDSATSEPQGTLAWLEVRDVRAHHHVRWGNAEDWQRLARRLTDRTVGLVFSGGSARGMAHIGVVQALEEAGQPVDSIGGTSMGALIGAGMAMGYASEDGVALAARFADPAAIIDRTLPYTSIMSSGKVTALLQELFGDRQIEDLWRPFFCVSTNLSTATPVVHDRGSLWRAVRASISLPGVFSPILNDKNELLVDGGVMNNFPLDIMADRAEFGLLIGSNVSPHAESPSPYVFGDSISGWEILFSKLNPFGQTKRAPSLVGTMLRTMEVNSLYHRKGAREMADILIEPDVAEFGIMAFDQYEALIERGYEASRATMNAARSAEDEGAI